MLIHCRPTLQNTDGFALSDIHLQLFFSLYVSNIFIQTAKFKTENHQNMTGCLVSSAALV